MRILLSRALAVPAVVLAVLCGCGPTDRGAPAVADDGESSARAEPPAPATAAGPGALTAGGWRLETLGANGTAVSPVAGTEVAVAFAADGRITGTGGCNRFSGSYETGEGRALSFSPLAATRTACPPEIMSQEDSFFVALGRVASFDIEGDRLSLAASDGSRVLRFVAVEDTDDGDGSE